jgi:hypothetical protein
MIGTNISYKTKTSITAIKKVKTPLVADLKESFWVKYSGVRYSAKDIYLQQARIRLQKLFFFSDLSDLKSRLAEILSSSID